MRNTIEVAAFQRATDPLLQYVTRGQISEIVAYRGDEVLQQRIEHLASKSNGGELTETEALEYAGYVRANKFLAVFQAYAQRLLEQSGDLARGEQAYVRRD